MTVASGKAWLCPQAKGGVPWKQPKSKYAEEKKAAGKHSDGDLKSKTGVASQDKERNVL